MMVIARGTDGTLFVQEYIYIGYGIIREEAYGLKAIKGLILESADEDFFCIDGLSKEECDLLVEKAYKQGGRLNLDINGYILRDDDDDLYTYS